MSDTIFYAQTACDQLLVSMRTAASQVKDAESILRRISLTASSGGQLRLSGGGARLSDMSVIRNISSDTVSSTVLRYRQALFLYGDTIESAIRALQHVSELFMETESRLQYAVEETPSLNIAGIAAGALQGAAAMAQHAVKAAGNPPDISGIFDHYNSATMGKEYNQEMSEAMVEFSQLAYDAFDPGKQESYEAMLRSMGFDPANVVKMTEPECIIASRMNADGTPTVVIAFRGSSDTGDWIDNLEFFTTPDDIHYGFNSRVKKFLRRMNTIHLPGIDGSPTLGQLLNNTKSGQQANILITGHSLGGAEAQLLNYHLVNRGVPNESITTYTFAAPHPMESAESTYFFNLNPIDALFHPNENAIQNAQCYNIVNPADPVTYIGAQILRGRNVGKDIRLNVDPPAIPTDFGQHTGTEYGGDQLATYRTHVKNRNYRA